MNPGTLNSKDSSNGQRKGHDAQRIADALRRRNRISIRINGSGLLPWVKPGDIAMIRATSPSAVEPGDLLLLKLGSHLRARQIPNDLPAEKVAEFLSQVSSCGSEPAANSEGCELLGCIVHLQRGQEMIDCGPARARQRSWDFARPIRRLAQALRPTLS